MAGKRIKNPTLIRTDFSTAVSNSAELLVDWDPLVEARALSLALVGNAYIQGSATGGVGSYVDTVLPSHDYIRISTDGGSNWLPIPIGDLTALTADSHPALTLGTANGLSLDVPNQVLSLAAATISTPGALTAADKIKIDTLIIDSTGDKFYANDPNFEYNNSLQSILSDGNRFVYADTTGSQRIWAPISFNYLDSPNTTSATTYTMAMRTTSNTTLYSQRNGATAHITLMEIAGS